MSSSFAQLLESGDVQALRSYWASAFPSLPQADTFEKAEIQMHYARTNAESVSLKHRAYSHRWLSERGLPSGLPDELKSKAERLYPVVREAVGISVGFKSPVLVPAAIEVRKAMEYAVLDAYADNKRDPIFVRQRMTEAKDKALRSLFGV